MLLVTKLWPSQLVWPLGIIKRARTYTRARHARDTRPTKRGVCAVPPVPIATTMASPSSPQAAPPPPPPPAGMEQQQPQHQHQRPGIQAIPTASVSKICSGQVVLDLATAVKELVENALDAGASSVEVRLKEHGLELIEVADNGRGVAPQDHASLALKYHTSKISQFQDLESLHTFGFRGEALSALAALGELSVTTRTGDQAAAARLEFSADGRLAGSSGVARAAGTTVAVKGLFGTLPVRRQEFTRNVRREVAKLKLLLQQYAIMTPQAQLFASDQAGKSARTVLVSTSNAGAALAERVSAVLGSKVAALLVPLEVSMPDEGISITGLVSRAGCGVKGDKLRQFVCINGRPVELPRAIKTLNDTYKSLYSSLIGLRPLAFLALTLPPGSFDVNVTPDKRSVFMQREVAVMAALQQALQVLWEPSRYTFAVNSTQEAFDTQRQLPAAAAAAAGDDSSRRQQKQKQRRQRGSSAAAVGDDSEEEEEEQEEEEEEESAADTSEDGNDDRTARHAAAAGPSRGAAGDARPNLAAFMIGSQPSQQQQQQPAPGDAAAPVAAAGQKRLRPLAAALLGKKVAKGQAGATAAAAAAAAQAAAAAAAAVADNSVDVADSQEQSAAAGGEADESSSHQQKQQPQGLPPALAGFGLGGGMQAGSPAAAAAPGDGRRLSSGQTQQRQQRRGAGGDGTQTSLAAFGFDVVPRQQQQHQEREASEQADEEYEQQPGGGREPDEQQERQCEAADSVQHAAAVLQEETAAAAMDADDGDEDEPVLVHEAAAAAAGGGTSQHAPGASQQQQPQQPRVPVVVDYPLQQLQADMAARLQQLRAQQQQKPGGGGGAGVRQLAAASLQGDADGSSGNGEAAPAAAADGGGGELPAAAREPADAATAELSRVFNKAEFGVMQPVGQFNLGFIIARLRNDLFIVDQHAADEKSTFERLMGSYAVNKQPLLQPRRLTQLTPMDQQVIQEHMDVFTRNGFEFVESADGQQQGGTSSGKQASLLWGRPPRSKAAVAAAAAAATAAAAGDASPGDSAPEEDAAADAWHGNGCAGGSELMLSAVPVLRGTSAGGGAMGEETLLELLDLIAAGQTRTDDIRPKRVRDVLASRSCRTSIMIGSPLNKQQQARIVARLAELQAPFNCPHGRPTMRHLAVLPEA